MKSITITIFAPDPEKKLIKGLAYSVQVEDTASIIDVLSALDKEMINNPEKSIFPLYKGTIYSFLQLIWDVEENKIYEDCGIDVYGPNKEFMPLSSDVNFNLYPNSNIVISVHAD